MVLLSFDIEEFDMPFEYGKTIAFEDQIGISVTGTNQILDLLLQHGFKATFFSTVIFAQHAPDVIQRIKKEGHELASHSYYHSKFDVADLATSKKALADLFGTEIMGFRMPRMMPVDEKEIALAGYLYNSSINPTWLPGRYNNLNVSRSYFKKEGVWQLPASVSRLRIPLFWLSFHNFPIWLYTLLAKNAYRKDGYLNIYFHPWEFTPLDNQEAYGFPAYVSRNSGKKMVERFDRLLKWINANNYPNGTIADFIAKRIE
ncbi:MAG: polysaccharide deacetylase family protein [Pedobacter sp.]|nr:polysaccharide deacetylase family protein [Pedobacter sp.]MDQ8051986.1 polysaccharide deacetylase family protein [Pedobacter sp.]